MTDNIKKKLFLLEDVGKVYQMGEIDVPVLHDVNMQIYRGELLVIVGPSGSGKSTLINMIGGIDQPTSGSIWFEDQCLNKFSDKELTNFRRESVGFIFQFYNLIPSLTARENVQVSTEISEHPIDPMEALKMVGLGDRADHFPSQLSGGEQQRVSIARALAKDPQLLLCDEPTGALDLATGKSVLELLDRLAHEFDKTVVIITHNTPISQIADRVIHLGDGNIANIVENKNRLSPEEIVW